MLISQVAELMNALIGRGQGDLDHSGLAALLEEMSAGV